MLIKDSRFEANRAMFGGAVFNFNGDLFIEDSTFRDNRAETAGGAIALGHPFGMTGNRQIATLLHELRRRKERFGVVSMCIGSGQGAAAVFEANLDGV